MHDIRGGGLYGQSKSEFNEFAGLLLCFYYVQFDLVFQERFKELHLHT